MSFHNMTLYMDIPVPFTRWIIVCDIGKYSCFGYRLKPKYGGL